MEENIEVPVITVRKKNISLADCIKENYKSKGLTPRIWMTRFIGFNSKRLALIKDDEVYKQRIADIKNRIKQVKTYLEKSNRKSVKKYAKLNKNIIQRRLNRLESRINIFSLRRDINELKKNEIKNREEIKNKNAEIRSEIENMMKNTKDNRSFVDLTAELVAQEKGLGEEDTKKFLGEFRGTFGVSKESKRIKNFKLNNNRFNKNYEKLKEAIGNKSERYIERKNSPKKEPAWKKALRIDRNMPRRSNHNGYSSQRTIKNVCDILSTFL